MGLFKDSRNPLSLFSRIVHLGAIGSFSTQQHGIPEMTKNCRQLHCMQEVIPYKSFTKKANLMK